MKLLLVVALCLLSGCGGSFWLTPNGHRAFYKSSNGQLSCYTDNCCWPYKEKVMICTQATGIDGASVVIKVIPDN